MANKVLNLSYDEYLLLCGLHYSIHKFQNLLEDWALSMLNFMFFYLIMLI